MQEVPWKKWWKAEIEILDNAVTLKITTTWFYTDSLELESTKFDSFEQNPKKSNLIFVRKESQTNNLILLWTLCSNFGFDSLLGWNPNLDLILCWFKVARKRVWFSLIFSFGSKLVFEFNSNRVLNTHLQEKKATCCNKPWYVFEVDLLLSSKQKKKLRFWKVRVLVLKRQQKCKGTWRLIWRKQKSFFFVWQRLQQNNV